MDQLIEQTAGMTIAGIFEEHGEAMFRKWESDILLELCKRDKVVVSTGGGAPCHNELIGIMNENGSTVYIELKPAVLMDRLIKSTTRRPLIEGKSAPELLDYITELLREREIYYKRAQYTIDGTDLLLIETLINLLD